jgi:RNA polymerase sigma-70 factor (ECF subfamily)
VFTTLQNITLEFEPEAESERRPEEWSELACLVRRAQGGDRAAFGLLIEQFQRTVHAICLRRLGNPSEAIELTQEVFLHVMRRLDQLREPERFAGWLRQVTVRMAINRATRRIAPSSVETAVLEGASEQRDDPLAELITRERAQRLWEAIARLKVLDREALVAFYIQGQSLVEIAERFDVPIGTVKRRLHTARRRLKVELQNSVSDDDEWSEEREPLDDDVESGSDLVGVGAPESAAW